MPRKPIREPMEGETPPDLDEPEDEDIYSPEELRAHALEAQASLGEPKKVDRPALLQAPEGFAEKSVRARRRALRWVVDEELTRSPLRAKTWNLSGLTPPAAELMHDLIRAAKNRDGRKRPVVVSSKRWSLLREQLGDDARTIVYARGHGADKRHPKMFALRLIVGPERLRFA